VSIELALRDVRTGYGPVEVLHGISLDVPAGALTAVLGPNGAGKTTLLSMIAGLIPLRGGDIEWRGRPINSLEPNQRAKAGMVLVPERRGVFPDLSVRENLEVFAGSKRGWDPALDAFPILRTRLDQTAGLMSGGEQQMLAMARGLATDPALLLLDELSMGLAPIIVEELYEIVAQIAREGVSILVVEQFASTVLGVADFAAILVHGKVARAGAPEALQDELSKAYLGA
jgi:branched-chain amino acid transport system ATP-binding protein